MKITPTIERPRRVIVLGAINMDVVVGMNGEQLGDGALVGQTLNLYPGGKGANQAVAASRMGARTIMVGRVGRDDFGDRLLGFLRENGVDTTYLGRDEKAATGTVVLKVTETGANNTLVFAPGANNAVESKDLGKINLTKVDTVLCQLEVPAATVEAMLKWAKGVGARTILNYAPAMEAGRSLLPLPDILVVNETELAFISGETIDPSQEEVVVRAMLKVRANPSQTVIATLGREGAIALIGQTIIKTPTRTVKAVDTTGAGDCFIGTLAAELNRRVPLDGALASASLAASISVERPGAGVSLPTREEVDAVRRSIPCHELHSRIRELVS